MAVKFYTLQRVTFLEKTDFPEWEAKYAEAISGKEVTEQSAKLYLKLILQIELEKDIPIWFEVPNAITFIQIDEHEKGIDELYKAYDKKQGILAWMLKTAVFDTLRTNTRYIELLHRLKLD